MFVDNKQFRQLVAYRAEAIDTAFGDMFGALPAELQVKLVTRDPEFQIYGGREASDQKRRTLYFPRRVLGSKMPNPLRWAAYYWPFYQNEQYRLEFPVIEAIENVLLNAYLQEAATVRGLSWPHNDCAAVDVGRRLPCEKLIKGIAEYVKARGARCSTPIASTASGLRISPSSVDACGAPTRSIWMCSAMAASC